MQLKQEESIIMSGVPQQRRRQHPELLSVKYDREISFLSLKAPRFSLPLFHFLSRSLNTRAYAPHTHTHTQSELQQTFSLPLTAPPLFSHYSIMFSSVKCSLSHLSAVSLYYLTSLCLPDSLPTAPSFLKQFLGQTAAQLLLAFQILDILWSRRLVILRCPNCYFTMTTDSGFFGTSN